MGAAVACGALVYGQPRRWDFEFGKVKDRAFGRCRKVEWEIYEKGGRPADVEFGTREGLETRPANVVSARFGILRFLRVYGMPGS